MFSFPFFRYPYSNYYSPYYGSYIKKNHTHVYKQPSQSEGQNAEQFQPQDTVSKKEDNNYTKKSLKYSSFGPIHFSNHFMDSNLEDPILEILGIQLYLDDLIILGLLFLLYKEKVKDEMLFLALIILLLS